jgi:signal transduction histidine kinase
MHLSLERCDLAGVVREAIETIEPAIAAKGQHLRIELAETMIVTGDPDRLRQAVWNLMSNAAKFTPVGGAITVRGETRTDNFVLEVADTGSGIAADALPRIFERFWQVDSTHTRGYGGLGLGLSLVRHFIELHGGSVTAHSEGIGKGARFVIELPRGGPDKKKGGG